MFSRARNTFLVVKNRFEQEYGTFSQIYDFWISNANLTIFDGNFRAL